MKNKLLNDWVESLKQISQHTGVYDINLQDHVLSLDAYDCHWSFDEDEQLLIWGEHDYDVTDRTGNEYASDCKYFFRGDDFCLALAESDFGDDDFFLILDTKREIKQ